MKSPNILAKEALISKAKKLENLNSLLP